MFDYDESSPSRIAWHVAFGMVIASSKELGSSWLIELYWPSNLSGSPGCRFCWFDFFNRLAWPIGITWTIFRSPFGWLAPAMGFGVFESSSPSSGLIDRGYEDLVELIRLFVPLALLGVMVESTLSLSTLSFSTWHFLVLIFSTLVDSALRRLANSALANLLANSISINGPLADSDSAGPQSILTVCRISDSAQSIGPSMTNLSRSNETFWPIFGWLNWWVLSLHRRLRHCFRSISGSLNPIVDNQNPRRFYNQEIYT